MRAAKNRSCSLVIIVFAKKTGFFDRYKDRRQSFSDKLYEFYQPIY